jgi:hypothetical protein
MLVREKDKGRMDLAVYLQLPPGKAEMPKGVVQDAPLLPTFPTDMDQKGNVEENEKYNYLNNFDVIVCFDPDWTQLTEGQVDLLETWATHHGGGLVLVGGPINTLELARPAVGPAGGGADAHPDKMGKIRGLYPVELADIRAEAIERKTDEPWPLHFTDKATPDYEFLKLAEDVRELAKKREDLRKYVSAAELPKYEQLWDEKTPDGAPAPAPPPFQSDWKAFFGLLESGEKDPEAVPHGFFNLYPVRQQQPWAQVLATFGDPLAAKDGKEMPYLVTSSPSDTQRRIVWLGWGEMYRLRQTHEPWHERFWTKLLRFAGGLREGKVVQRIEPNMASVFREGQQVPIEARIDGPDGKRLDPKAKPVVRVEWIAPPEGETKKLSQDQQKVQDQLLADFAKPRFLTYKPGSDGWFAARVQPPIPGRYRVDISVEETKDKLDPALTFDVLASNPEMDDKRPDFDHLFQIASLADKETLARLSESDRRRVWGNLAADNKESKPGKAKAGEAKDVRPRLYFDLANGDVIPQCIPAPPAITSQVFGDPKPVWDNWLVLLLLVGLMSLEWLSRKLLRLA